MILLLFSTSYPYDVGIEQTFLDIEVQYLQKAFDRVILVPRKCQGNRLSLPDGIEVDESYADSLNKIHPLATFRKIFFSPSLYQEIRSLPWLLRYPSAIKRLLIFLAGAQMTNTWVSNWLTRSNANPTDCLFYTYWFDQAAYGIELAKQKHPQLKIVSRVHGYDLYEEVYYRPPYWPRRKAALALIDRLFVDAQAGFTYLNERYPEFASVYELSTLGVPDPGFTTPASVDNVFRIVSCSMLVPVKRVDLLLKGIANAAKSRPEQQFEWHHFGNGESRLELQELANSSFPPNAKGYLPGYSTLEDLMNYYEQNPVDAFVNVSVSEGISVSIQEAVSCGIPIIATKAGGSPEIVSERNGILLDPNPSPDEVAQALLKICDNPEITNKMRNESRQVWEESYNADVIYYTFSQRLKEIRQSKVEN